MTKPTVEKTTWQINVPIFKNVLILKQMLIAIGIPFGAVILFLLFNAFRSGSKDAYYGIGLILLLFISGILLLMVAFGGQYAVAFEMDEKGITCRSQDRYRRKSKVIGFLTVFLSLFSKSPTAAGAGLLGQSRHTVRIKWSDICKVKFYPKYRTILVKENALNSLGIFCTKENYTTIETYIKKRLIV
ncbi:MAG: hypothetical protein Q8S24_00945 [Eubacteriales bacterium]|nr:hypothetical protein [Eubacteriales bacterium]